ncbi:uncharacterized protein KQ657_001579 [Scheffersomyces spartinae]|uniref:Carbohydrate kinase PfkB domain-containing protein n=1 Tax=Scheffersomyces spartinae TaxID=45513 RepID=A0A9P7V6X0_9ASCO|nr:uncharacterized protein KQ657_001579 [Scheffersomyces spartinae]KAG7192485.1 hypothetical protein KQ657_001579 [Scheffersomyces spartinae]
MTVSTPLFTSLGMFIIDDNQYPIEWDREDDLNVIGGGGSYAIVGARIIAGFSRAPQICGIIDKGYDFPLSVEQELQSWKCGLVYRTDETRRTTRGVNVYDKQETRGFYYKTDKKRIEPEDVVDDQRLCRSKSYHLLCSVERCRNFIDDIGQVNREAVYIYEPIPDVCIPENIELLKELVLGLIDVFSPNLKEACLLAGIEEISLDMNNDINESITALESLASTFTSHMTKEGSGVVIRCGAHGCYVSSSNWKGMLPAYHDAQDTQAVVDVTGGGNAYCGGFVVGLLMSGYDWKIAGICGNLASGCVIEQLGMPLVDAGVGNNNGDVWNKIHVLKRFQNYVTKHAINNAQLSWMYPEEEQ